MRSVVTIGNAFSPEAYRAGQGSRGLEVMPRPELVQHEFLARADGQLEHLIDGRSRAIVPPEGFDAYVHCWPAAAPVVKTLKAADRFVPAAAATTPRAVRVKPAPKKKRKGKS